ncbi:MAG: phosphocarrier protein HPr [Deltaproteobacteria bacterium HGW-Deltaproteobacteria-17]|nr:MAG: phosphocarrier protein HPr [Deltaproteobacteria bacterium HGW-Deltaproteobacteria-17]
MRHEIEVELINEQGMHTRPAKLFVETAVKFTSEIEVSYDGLSANGKSIMGLLGLLAYRGCRLVISATGDDAKPAVEALAGLVNSGFNE